jgi:hypothetical protein
VPTFDAAALIFNGLRKVTPSNPRSGARRADYEDEGEDDDEAQVFLRHALRSGSSAVPFRIGVTPYRQAGTGSSDRFCPPIQVK